MFQSLSGKRVVIIGASSGIGLAVAHKTAELSASVVMSSRSSDKLHRAVESVLEQVEVLGQVETIAADMLNEESIDALFKQVGNFDHLVVTAVADENLLRSPLAEMSTELAQRGMEKFWGTFFAARAAAKTLAQNGSITLTSSVSIFKPAKTGGVSVMSAASVAVAVFGRSLAAELAPIRVNVIAPGVVDTGVWSNTAESQRSELAKWAEESLPVQHLGQAEELAQAVLSLMTNTYITGVILPVDGGLTLL
jgi:NAD(P)-dependent dehydrogenase (short-subunit alcohol dehydrogenase family)